MAGCSCPTGTGPAPCLPSTHYAVRGCCVSHSRPTILILVFGTTGDTHWGLCVSALVKGGGWIGLNDTSDTPFYCSGGETEAGRRWLSLGVPGLSCLHYRAPSSRSLWVCLSGRDEDGDEERGPRGTSSKAQRSTHCPLIQPWSWPGLAETSFQRNSFSPGTCYTEFLFFQHAGDGGVAVPWQ